MLYSIIPPILVVLSLVGIIIFLVKKAPKVSQLGKDEQGSPSQIDLREPGFFGRSAQRLKQTDWRSGKNFFAAVFGKVADGFKFVVARVSAPFSLIGNRLKNIKKRKAAEGGIAESAETGTKKDESVIETARRYSPEKKIIINKSAGKPRTDEIKVEPMISKEAVKPRTEMKDRLEELLIERIAANPKDIEAYERLGQYYMEIENYEYAKECYKQVVKLNPTDRNSKFTLKKLERLLSQ